MFDGKVIIETQSVKILTDLQNKLVKTHFNNTLPYLAIPVNLYPTP